jgi:hypothetical protein
VLPAFGERPAADGAFGDAELVSDVGGAVLLVQRLSLLAGFLVVHGPMVGRLNTRSVDWWVIGGALDERPTRVRPAPGAPLARAEPMSDQGGQLSLFCGTCAGSGVVVADATDQHGDPVRVPALCPTCRPLPTVREAWLAAARLGRRLTWWVPPSVRRSDTWTADGHGCGCAVVTARSLASSGCGVDGGSFLLEQPGRAALPLALDAVGLWVALELPPAAAA